MQIQEEGVRIKNCVPPTLPQYDYGYWRNISEQVTFGIPDNRECSMCMNRKNHQLYCVPDLLYFVNMFH